MKIIYFGSGAFGLPTLDTVARSSHKIVAVITQPDRPAGRGKHLEPTPAKVWAAREGLPIISAENVNAPEIVSQIAAFGADGFLVIAFGQKLSDTLLSVPKLGSINLHSSLLPKYRGAAPINWALLNNDAQTGVTVLRVSNVMDGGEILAASRTPIEPSETAGELHDRLALLGALLVVHVLDSIEAGTAQGMPQDASLRSAAPKLSRQMAWVDFSQDAARVSARIRGLSPWPGCAVQVMDATEKFRTQATIVKCRVSDLSTVHDAPQQGVVLADRSIACGTGSIELLQIQPAGKKSMDAKAFANGYGLAAGAKLISVEKAS